VTRLDYVWAYQIEATGNSTNTTETPLWKEDMDRPGGCIVEYHHAPTLPDGKKDASALAGGQSPWAHFIIYPAQFLVSAAFTHSIIMIAARLTRRKDKKGSEQNGD
jgi:hypothetical protein